MPSFTKFGYKKMKIPEELYEMIINSKNLSDITSEDFQINEFPFLYNHQRITKDGIFGRYD